MSPLICTAPVVPPIVADAAELVSLFNDCADRLDYFAEALRCVHLGNWEVVAWSLFHARALPASKCGKWAPKVSYCGEVDVDEKKTTKPPQANPKQTNIFQEMNT